MFKGLYSIQAKCLTRRAYAAKPRYWSYPRLISALVLRGFVQSFHQVLGTHT